MNRIHISLGVFFCLVTMSSCLHSNKGTTETTDSLPVRQIHNPILVTDEQLEKENGYDERGDELFDDFLYAFLHDSVFQRNRTESDIMEIMPDGSVRKIDVLSLDTLFNFMNGEYTTSIYNNDEHDKYLNEDTALALASVEKIDLVQRTVTSFAFARSNSGIWKLHSIQNNAFNDSDLSDFLNFYSQFTINALFREKYTSNKIHISMMAPDDDSQTIDGFINREQWNAIGNNIPDGVISNIRYGQKYNGTRKILLEKTSLGNGMSETFVFVKGRRGWEFVGYEN